jgi:hypothetical protein
MKRKLIVMFALSLLIIMASVVPAPCPENPPPPVCPEGCTPGYWKNHLEAWDGLFIPEDPNTDPTLYIPPIPLTPTTRLDVVFSSLYLPDGSVLDPLSDDTLLDALGYGGGTGVRGAAKILLRQAVAGLLNAAHPGVNWIVGPENIWYIQMRVNDVLNAREREDIIILAGRFEGYNELLCPLGNTRDTE